MRAHYLFIFALAIGLLGSLTQSASAQETNTTDFNVDVVETDVTYQTPGGTTLLTAQNLLVSRQLSDYTDQNLINGQLFTALILESLGYSPDPGEVFPELKPPLNLTPYAAANLPLLGGASRFDFVSDFGSDPGNVNLPTLLLDHTGQIDSVPLADEFTAGPTDAEGLLPGATVTSFSDTEVDNQIYLDTGTNSDDSVVVQSIINANFDQISIIETVGVPENSNAALLLAVALGGLFAFGIWRSMAVIS